MATTDSRTGFRLPWSTDQHETDGADSAADASAESEVAASDDQATVEATETGEAGSPQGDADDRSGGGNTMVESSSQAAPATASGGARKPNKFLADLTKAMQTAAEAAREESLGRFAADAKSFVEQIHARSSEESTALRGRADDDISQIRDWSKAEIARIREETEQRITDRKARLEQETEQHAAQIEREIERVQERVGEFEADMARFFERLLAEEDPTRFAAMAENLPEPPSFDVAEALAEAAAWSAPAWTPDSARSDVDEPHSSTPHADEPAEAGEPEGAADVLDDVPAPVETEGEPNQDPEAAFAAIQAAAEAAEAAEAAAAAGATVEAAEPDTTTHDAGHALSESDSTDHDAALDELRVAALALAPDSAAAAEAEALAAGDGDAGTSTEDYPTIDEDALAARLAGLLPGPEAAAASAAATPSDAQSTQVVVVGLVSVASIASFKRHLGRLPGVQSVGVSSGPDGEFVFAVVHGPDVVLTESVPTLPGFQARVTASGEGVVNVTAHDPEAEA